jgi:hypothetical protein
MSDSVADNPVEQLEWHANQVRLIAEQLGDPYDTLLDGGEAAACVYAITTGSARALRALAAWHSAHDAELFDREGGAEQDATAVIRASAKELRAFAAELEAAAQRHQDLIEQLRRLVHPDVYEVQADEVDDEDEYYAIVVAEPASSGVELVHRRYTRVDVARAYARQLAHSGSYRHAYRVVPAREEQRNGIRR